MPVTIQYRSPLVNEYQLLRNSTNWGELKDEQVAIALANSLFSVCMMLDDQIVASGRIIGDGLYFYIQDVIVLPDHQGNGLGKKVMLELNKWLEQNAPSGSFIGLMAAEGSKEFYQKLGFEVRGTEKPGMYRLIQ